LSYDFSRSVSALAWYALALGRYTLVYWSDASFPLLSPSASAASGGIYSTSMGSGGGAAYHHQYQGCTDCSGSAGSACGGAESDGQGAAALLVLRPYQAIITWLVGCSTILALWPLVVGFLRNRDPHHRLGQDNGQYNDPLSNIAVAGGMGYMLGLAATGLLSSV
jgi:hypothetical protein